ncbi:hypothetical protein [Salinibacter ruber]|uniref:hypothetical protein n=1 Tax=Salinibacter ruber TaxID=146919 RepID=UPI0013C2DC78|nr:hypothetical protein [Salinibacter ruber]
MVGAFLQHEMRISQQREGPGGLECTPHVCNGVIIPAAIGGESRAFSAMIYNVSGREADDNNDFSDQSGARVLEGGSR